MPRLDKLSQEAKTLAFELAGKLTPNERQKKEARLRDVMNALETMSSGVLKKAEKDFSDIEERAHQRLDQFDQNAKALFGSLPTANQDEVDDLLAEFQDQISAEAARDQALKAQVNALKQGNTTEKLVVGGVIPRVDDLVQALNDARRNTAPADSEEELFNDLDLDSFLPIDDIDLDVKPLTNEEEVELMEAFEDLPLTDADIDAIAGPANTNDLTEEEEKELNEGLAALGPTDVSQAVVSTPKQPLDEERAPSTQTPHIPLAAKEPITPTRSSPPPTSTSKTPEEAGFWGFLKKIVQAVVNGFGTLFGSSPKNDAAPSVRPPAKVGVQPAAMSPAMNVDSRQSVRTQPSIAAAHHKQAKQDVGVGWRKPSSHTKTARPPAPNIDAALEPLNKALNDAKENQQKFKASLGTRKEKIDALQKKIDDREERAAHYRNNPK